MRPITLEQGRSIDRGFCPDCGQHCLVLGPMGGMSRNIACAWCGSEFNVVMGSGFGHRNSVAGKPDYGRLESVFGIRLRKDGA